MWGRNLSIQKYSRRLPPSPVTRWTNDQHACVLPRNLTKLGYISSAMLQRGYGQRKTRLSCTSEVQRTYVAYIAPTQFFRSMGNFIGSYCNSVAGQAICVPLTVCPGALGTDRNGPYATRRDWDNAVCCDGARRRPIAADGVVQVPRFRRIAWGPQPQNLPKSGTERIILAESINPVWMGQP